jgi:peptide deformylase
VPVLTIAEVGDPILRAPTRTLTQEELASPDIQSFIDDMIETMHDAHGAGLAANQVYRSLRICVIEVQNNPRYPYKPPIPLTVLVNPTLTYLGDESFDNYEGCLSVPNLRGIVSRHVHVVVDAWDRHGVPLNRRISGLSAGTYQHEIDHLDGALFLDRVSDPVTLATWSSYDRFHRASFEASALELVKQHGA